MLIWKEVVMIRIAFAFIAIVIVASVSLYGITGCTKTNIDETKKHSQTEEPYQTTWTSLKNHTTPQWLKDAKFGIYTHWGVYSVPAYDNVWYPNKMYRKGNIQYEYHIKTYGPPEKFGYKDFIPLFKAEKFNAEE